MSEAPEQADGAALTDREYWRSVQGELELSLAHPRDTLRRWIEGHVPRARPGQTAIEIGCYPGRYLSVLGELGYELSGIDYLADLQAMRRWFEGQGYAVGELVQGDFFQVELGRRFDVVLSVGFIEHFRDWPRVLARHAALVADGGTLLLASPNFGGAVQGWFHRRFDRASYDKHFVPAMDPAAWATVLRPLGFEVVEAGHVGRLTLWVEEQPPSPLDRLLVAASLQGVRVLKRLLPAGRPSYAPYCGLVAKHPSGAAERSSS